MAGPLTEVRVRITIGRGNDRSIRVLDEGVLEAHASIDVASDGAAISPNDANALVLVNGSAVTQPTRIQAGDVIRVGSTRFTWNGTSLSTEGVSGGARLEASALQVISPGGHVLVDGVSVTIEPNELVAIVGPSGAGKTSLMRALVGLQPVCEGAVLYDGTPLDERSDLVARELGFVPQFATVHAALTVREALRFAACLRMPEGYPAQDREERITQILASVGLAHAADTRIENVSGGEAKRASIAMELIGNPRVLLADEPTSGLDPMLDERIMRLFRSLATLGRTVIVTTHSPLALESCDRILMLGRGGRVTFYGSPSEMLAWFDSPSIPSTYEIVARNPDAAAARWAAAHPPAPVHPAPAPSDAHLPPAAPGPGAMRQLTTLVHRYAVLLSRDRRHMLTVLAQAPLLGLLLCFVLDSGVWANGDDPAKAQTAAFSLVLVAVWLGLLNASREIVKERGIFLRERMVGVQPSTYLLSKAIPLLVLTALQAFVLTWLVVTRAGVPSIGMNLPASMEITITVFLCGFAATAAGLVVSTWSSSEDGAGSLIPYVIIPQVMLGGVLFHLSGTFAHVRDLTITWWGTRAIDTTLNVCDRGSVPRKLCTEQLGASLTASSGTLHGAWLVLIGACVVLLLTCWWGLTRERQL